MQAVTILADQVRQNAAVLQLDQAHMRRGWDGLKRVYGLQVALPSLSLERPHAFRTTKVRNTWVLVSLTSGEQDKRVVMSLTSGSGDTCSSEDDEVFTLRYLVDNFLGFAVHSVRRVIALFFGNFGGGGGHADTCNDTGIWIWIRAVPVYVVQMRQQAANNGYF